MGEILRQGIDAYRQSMNPSGKTPDDVKKAPPPEKTGGVYNNADGLIKTVPAQSAESKTRRVAKFLILIGSDKASKILGELDSKQVEEISKEIASIKGIDQEEANAITAEFQSLLSGAYRYSGPSFGGVETARSMLHAALGEEKGEALLQKTILSLPKISRR